MKLLDEIIQRKRIEVEAAKQTISKEELIEYVLYKEERRSLKRAIVNGSGIIAEYKRKSPSAGEITNAPLEEILEAYSKNKVSAFSVLTDGEGFGGSLNDLVKARGFGKPILRKDFIIDEYQIFEAKAHGADAILLIAEVMNADTAKHLCQIAKSIGLEVLMEFHTLDQLGKIPNKVDLVGVNNRNLSTMTTSIKNAEVAYKHLPNSAVKIAESGIKSVDEIIALYELGYQGALIGESLLKDEAFRNGLNEIKSSRDYAN